MSGEWVSRAVRAAVFAAVCVLLAALGHILMSEATVPWWALAAGTLAVGGVAWALTGCERGLLAVTSVAVVTQGALHAGFSLVQTTAPARTSAHMSPGSMGHTHMGHATMGSHDTYAAEATGHAVHGAGSTSSTGMLAAHLLAALLCGLWLAHGERAAFRILRACAGWLLAPLRLVLRLPTPPHRPRVRARREHPARTPHRLLLASALTFRGPPTGTAVI
ncbi:hypothetical protein AB0J57_27555 [Streptomyces sp. NPDC049837]|uniref:hypothetical protein n=1 Tax=Streptomyces sp. NPDC049837 TaxID=3155277 RepID=UPI00344781A6